MELLAEIVDLLAVPLLHQLLLRLELVGLVLKLHRNSFLLSQNSIMSLLFKFKLFVLFDRELECLPLLCEENEQLFELLARLCLILYSQLHLLLHDIVPLLKLYRYLGFLRAFLLLRLKLPGQLLY